MAIIAVGTRCDLLFLDVESQFVSQDEGDFLEMMAAFQTGNVDRAQARLDMWLPVSAKRIAGTAFEEFAGLLVGRGMPIGSQNSADLVRAKRQNIATVIARLH
jgi:dihydrodipicolinate synthase/N-acetylneuraminate lyase